MARRRPAWAGGNGISTPYRAPRPDTSAPERWIGLARILLIERTMAASRRLVHAGLLFPVLAACAPSTGSGPCSLHDEGVHEVPLDRPVWSDSAVEVAALSGSYELLCYDDSYVSDVATSHYEDERTQLFVVDPVTFERRAVGS